MIQIASRSSFLIFCFVFTDRKKQLLSLQVKINKLRLQNKIWSLTCCCLYTQISRSHGADHINNLVSLGNLDSCVRVNSPSDLPEFAPSLISLSHMPNTKRVQNKPPSVREDQSWVMIEKPHQTPQGQGESRDSDVLWLLMHVPKM